VSNRLPLHWRNDRDFNFGDRISPLLLQKLTGKQIGWVPADSPRPYLTLVGSFLEIVNQQAHVWGTGLLDSHHKPQPQAHYHAVRGPLTRQKILAAGGNCPEVYGDPVQLLARLIPLKHEPEFVGVIPQWREQGEICYQRLHDQRLKLLDITAPTEQFLADLLRCRAVLSASLHGIISAHAYGIPAMWIQPTRNPLGDGFKFRDYLASVDLSQAVGATFQSDRDLLHLAEQARAPQFAHDQFLQAFPAKQFGVDLSISQEAT